MLSKIIYSFRTLGNLKTLWSLNQKSYVQSKTCLQSAYNLMTNAFNQLREHKDNTECQNDLLICLDTSHMPEWEDAMILIIRSGSSSISENFWEGTGDQKNAEVFCCKWSNTDMTFDRSSFKVIIEDSRQFSVQSLIEG